MKYYKVEYQLGERGEYIYPASTRGVVWQNAHYHHKDPFMVGETDAEVAADGAQVILLTKKDATTLLNKMRKSAPVAKEGDALLPK